MINQNQLKNVLTQYKADFVSRQWKNEMYKWEAVKWFQDHWDINAPDFPEMLRCSLEKTMNLLVSLNNFPRSMIVKFAKGKSRRSPFHVYRPV